MDRDNRLRERVHRGLASGVLFLIDHKSWAGRGSGGSCLDVVNAHGGAVGAENNPEGGASLRFTLPVNREVAR